MTDESVAGILVLSVGKFAARMTRWFGRDPQLKRIGIEGEISGLREFGNGHLGFALKERQAAIECVAWSGDRRRFPELENGAKAVAYGAVRVHAERSGYKLYVEAIEVAGLGELHLEYERLRRKFEAEGLFEPGRKRVVPELPRRLALVSSRALGAEDFLQAIARTTPFVEVLFVETRVEGLGADVEIATALDEASRLDVDAIVLARGGGSEKDLFAFNLEPAVRAIVRAKKPVLTAIGHTSNRHLCDEVADLSFGTPSLAAEYVAKGWLVAGRRLTVATRDLERAARDLVLRGAQRSESLGGGIERAAMRILTGKRAALAQRSARLERHNPQRTLADVRARLAASGGRLETAAARMLSRKAHAGGERAAELARAIAALRTSVVRRLERGIAGLDRLDPLAPLARGYAIVTQNGRAVRDAASLRAGDLVEARLERGMLAARVESVSDHA
ncbi:MAG TPA: exodeoxyribonuclease VII large subunit [Candidatus Tumulicola sp.]|jgi:exodeoxyribonuclease VII large subunit